MEHSQKGGARDFFLYLFATGALYFSAGSVITLLFEYVNRWLPDPAYQMYYGYDGFSSGLRWAISLLIIVFPAYVLVMRFLNREIDKYPEKREVGIRKVMVYLTLFLSAVAIIIDLIVLVNSFLGGELTARFGLKVVAVLLVAGLVLWYYLFNLKRSPGTRSGMREAFMWGSLAFVGATIVGAFFMVGSPAQNRALRMDSQRVNDLSGVQWQVINYWQAKQKLPVTLEETKDPISGYMMPVDPETGSAYEYKATGPRSFELCATFTTDSLKATVGGATKPIPVDYYGSPNENWQHSAGRTCFDRTIDPDLYPPYTKI
jgi:hypothetical protein